MGVPALYRWLSRKYPLINQPAREEKPIYNGTSKKLVDISLPNPNNVEFDNLYLDMNGIIHPCTHPENKPPPKNFDEMMVEIFIYIDRILSITRPRRLIYMAIDGVAPRAKMNQQRSRRFRAAQEMEFKKSEIDKIKESLYERGLAKKSNQESEENSFDSNCITPGTEFMEKLSNALKFYICDKIANHESWKNLVVILSDSNVPGEGEHKIIEFIRHQRCQKNYDPNTKHVLHGADADLLMLGLGTHEAYFTVLREEFKPRQAKPCEICKKFGHEFSNCDGNISELSLSKPPSTPSEYDSVSFIFVRIYVLRMYLTRMFKNCFPNSNFERHIDDWIFIIFFVGNDFLPHLPSLEINENAIDRLVKLYIKQFKGTKKFLTDSGIVNFKEVEILLNSLGTHEDNIFIERYDYDQKRKALNLNQSSMSLKNSSTNQLESFLIEESKDKPQSLDVSEIKEVSINEANDSIQFHKKGWKQRYYSEKFGINDDIDEFSQNVAYHYCRGLSWVLQYYFRGCPNWKWFYQFHYAPFSSDFSNISKIKNFFKPDSQPFKPFEQLMGVFPAASRNFIPKPYHFLMTDKNSPIIHFYPKEFKVDLNGKKWAWQGVALLPFVSEKELLQETVKIEPELSEIEKKRNSIGKAQIFTSKNSSLGKIILDKKLNIEKSDKILISIGNGNFISCILYSPNDPLPEKNYKSMISLCQDIIINTALCYDFENPDYPKDFEFSAKMLKNAVLPIDITQDWSNKRFSNNQVQGSHRNKAPKHNFSPQNNRNIPQDFSNSANYYSIDHLHQQYDHPQQHYNSSQQQFNYPQEHYDYFNNSNTSPIQNQHPNFINYHEFPHLSNYNSYQSMNIQLPDYQFTPNNYNNQCQNMQYDFPTNQKKYMQNNRHNQ